MNSTNGFLKSTDNRTHGRLGRHNRFLVLLAALLLTSCGSIHAEEEQVPTYKESVSETLYDVSTTCSCGCPYCCFPDVPADGIGREIKQVAAPAAAPVVRSDALDYTNGVIYGWDGRYCDLWEMDLFARTMYLEFWGCSPECCEAGCDAILRLLESGEYGNTLGELLKAEYAPGKYVYSVYPEVWTTKYDAEWLAYMRSLCEERFSLGPVWIAPYFRKDFYHDWATPAYNLDNVYFSVSSWSK